MLYFFKRLKGIILLSLYGTIDRTQKKTIMYLCTIQSVKSSRQMLLLSMRIYFFIRYNPGNIINLMKIRNLHPQTLLIVTDFSFTYLFNQRSFTNKSKGICK